jgi:PAS domain-containing protein
VLFALIALVSLTAIGTDLQFMFLVIPLLGWAAWRFQQRGAAPAALLVVLIASWAAAKGVGPFQAGTLLEKMLMLQAFNATVAFCSFFFAALVTERMQAHQALERAAVELDARVRQRTSQLYATNLYLRNEVAEREESERKLGQQEGQLAEAQQVAHIGSWEWMIPSSRLSWSDEMYRIHGYVPQAFPAAFELALAQVNTEDAARIRSNVEEALRRADDHDLPNIEYRITRDDGAARVLLGKAKMCVGPDGEPLRMFGTVQDVTEAGRPNASTGSLRRCSGAFCRIASPNFPACCSPRATSRPAPTWRSAATGTTSCNSQTGRLAWPSATWPATGYERPRRWDSYGWAYAPTRWRNRRRPRS